ncbi:hypothetical protein F5884DRAFT_766904 [Xylogone sp. PMI_703]|nr:hypothetical protein F5884DRAFT_766904 [Xylogone sp. PMI_703]
MTKEIESKKRKASIQNGEVEKMKKPKKAITENADVTAKKRKAVEDPTPVAVKKPKTPKVNTTEEIKSKAPKKTKAKESVAEKPIKPSRDSTKASKKVKSAEQPAEEVLRLDDDVDEHDEDQGSDNDSEGEGSEFSEEDDQTQALLKGFESEGDEEDADNEEGLKPGQEVPKIPVLSKKQMKQLAAAEEDEKPGVVYIGRIPHGFYEHEMRAYFEQFGKILKLRLSRNRRTGASRHIAWIQFAQASVAEIVAKAMNGYLLFNHILRIRVVPDEQVPENLFKGANRRFKKIPWGKLEARRLKLPAAESTWDKRIEREKKRRDEKAKKLKEIGYEFEAPEIRSTKGVAKKSDEVGALPPTDEANQDKVQSNEDAKTPTSPEADKPKKKTKKARASDVAEEVVEEPATPASEVVEKTKTRNKKAKTAAMEEDADPVDNISGEKKTKKSKKARAST